MSKEIEIKVLDISPAHIDSTLRKKGANFHEYFYRLIIYKLDEGGPVKEFIRLRDDGEQTTLAYKKKESSAHDATEEIEFGVSDFEQCAEFLENLGCGEPYYQERKRHQYFLNNIEFCVDFWPKIPPFLEIEAEDEQRIKEGLALLDLSWPELSNPDITELYQREGLNLFDYRELKFD